MSRRSGRTETHMASAPAILYPSRPSKPATTFDETRLKQSVLYLAYFFPPRGGAAVQRSLKFARYLPEFGWRPLVVANGGGARAPGKTAEGEGPPPLHRPPPGAGGPYTTPTPPGKHRDGKGRAKRGRRP